MLHNGHQLELIQLQIPEIPSPANLYIQGNLLEGSGSQAHKRQDLNQGAENQHNDHLASLSSSQLRPVSLSFISTSRLPHVHPWALAFRLLPPPSPTAKSFLWQHPGTSRASPSQKPLQPVGSVEVPIPGCITGTSRAGRSFPWDPAHPYVRYKRGTQLNTS